MSQSHKAKCADEIIEDPSLLGLFSEEECTSLLELLIVGTLKFSKILQNFYAHIAPHDIWGEDWDGVCH